MAFRERRVSGPRDRISPYPGPDCSGAVIRRSGDGRPGRKAFGAALNPPALAPPVPFQKLTLSRAAPPRRLVLADSSPSRLKPNETFAFSLATSPALKRALLRSGRAPVPPGALRQAPRCLRRSAPAQPRCGVPVRQCRSSCQAPVLNPPARSGPRSISRPGRCCPPPARESSPSPHGPSVDQRLTGFLPPFGPSP